MTILGASAGVVGAAAGAAELALAGAGALASAPAPPERGAHAVASNRTSNASHRRRALQRIGAPHSATEPHPTGALNRGRPPAPNSGGSRYGTWFTFAPPRLGAGVSRTLVLCCDSHTYRLRV